MKLKIEKEDLTKNKSVIFNRKLSRKSRFFLIFDRIEGDYAIGKTIPRKSSHQREERIYLKDIGSERSLIDINDYSYHNKFFVVKKDQRLNKFLCSKKMNRSFSRSLDQAECFDLYEEALIEADLHNAKVISHKKAVNYHNGNKGN